jgi:hypothetical protein
MDGFVDDTIIWQNLSNNLDELSQGSIGEIAARLKTAAQWWEQLLHATGGKLELPKCFYYLLHWVFDSEGQARLATPEELNIQISLRQSADNQDIDITQRCCTTSHCTLGVHENPSGNLQTECDHFVSKGKKMAHLISAELIARSEGWLAYRSIYLPSMSWTNLRNARKGHRRFLRHYNKKLRHPNTSDLHFLLRRRRKDNDREEERECGK